MSFNTFCGQDPADPLTYQKLLSEFQEDQPVPPANTVLITDTNANGVFPFVLTDAAGTGQKALFSDGLVNPYTINPFTGDVLFGDALRITDVNSAIPTSKIAFGVGAGLNNPAANSVALGTQAGETNLGQDSIAIGYRAAQAGLAANSICINATGAALNPAAAGVYIAPIRGVALGIGAGRVLYDPATAELVYSTN
jgi:uncharacterized spore protein YtfJ